MTKPTKKSKSIDEVMDDFWYIKGDEAVLLKQEIQALIDEAVRTEKDRIFYSYPTNKTKKEIQKLIDEAVEKERKRILDKKKLMSVMKNIVLGNTLNIINASFIADAIIKESEEG